jgi:hypothetical protein
LRALCPNPGQVRPVLRTGPAGHDSRRYPIATGTFGRPPAEPSSDDPVHVIARVMRVNGMVLEDLGEGLYRAHAPRWVVVVRVSGPVCAVYSVHPQLVTPERRGLLGEWLATENYDIANLPRCPRGSIESGRVGS